MIPGTIKLLQDLVAINSVNRDQGGAADAERELGDFLESFLKRNGFETVRQPVRDGADNILGLYPVRPESPWLLFVSHMDTVSVADMTISPFDPLIRDGRVYGRGACDTKAAAAAMLHALGDYAAGSGEKVNVALLFTVDEEMGKAGIRKFCQEPGRLRNLLGVIVGEPTGLRLVAAHCGVVRFKIETTGQAAHSSNPAQGESAISHMVKVIRKLEEEYIPSLKDRRHPLCGPAQCSVNTIRGGASVNIIPESCAVEVDRRVLPGEDVTAVFDEIQEHLRPLAATSRCRVLPPFMVDQPLADSENASRLLRGIAAVLAGTGLPPEPVGVPFGTEAANLAAAGFPAVVLGPGAIAQAHQADEWIEVEQVELVREVYSRIMREASQWMSSA